MVDQLSDLCELIKEEPGNFLTMKSARTKNLYTGDICSELIAQFLMQGRIEIKNNGLLPIKKRIEFVIKQLLDDCVGNIFVNV